MIFYAHNTVNGYETYVSDGTASGTFMLKDINPSSGNSYLNNKQEVTLKSNSKYCFFVAQNGVDTSLWRTDGTTLGTIKLTNGESVKNIDLFAIRQHLAKDVPVVIGMMVGGSFMQDMMGQEVWHPTDDDYNMIGFGGHAMCVIGYDDRKEGGAFQILNSWGNQWGQNGVAFVRYNECVKTCNIISYETSGIGYLFDAIFFGKSPR